MKYYELISQDKDAVKAQELEFVAKDAQNAVRVSIIEHEKALFQAERDLGKAQRANPYDLKREIALATEVEDLKDAIAKAKAIFEDRFTDDA